MLPDYISNHLQEIAKTLNFDEYTIETENASSHGNNFVGVMVAITIIGTRDVGGATITDEVHLVCKTPAINESLRRSFEAETVFDRELDIYATVLPEFMAFQREKGLSDDEQFTSFPKVYACDMDVERGIYLLIMEDLRVKQYEMWPKEQIVPIEHELMVMKELGKLHGISLAMKHQRPDQFAPFKRLTDVFGSVVRGKLKPFFDISVRKSAAVLKDPKHKEIMQRFDFLRMMDHCFSWESCDKFGVVAHGDSWNNNYMYQYVDNENRELKALCMIDWQLSRYCSPALDLLYNIFSSTDKAFRDKHFETLLQTYYASLSQMISRLGSSPKDLFTYEDLQSELRKFGEYVLLCAPMVIRIKVANAKDVRDLVEYSDVIETDPSVDLFLDFDEKTQLEYSRLVNEVVDDLIRYGFIEHK